MQKVKSYFFGHIYQSPFDSYRNSKKSKKLKPPNVESLFDDIVDTFFIFPFK
jgi:hypothetical protein